MEVNRKFAIKKWDEQFGKTVNATDFAGRKIQKGAFGQLTSTYGWTLTYIVPKAVGGTEAPENLICVHVKTASEKEQNFPSFNANDVKYKLTKESGKWEIIPSKDEDAIAEQKEKEAKAMELWALTFGEAETATDFAGRTIQRDCYGSGREGAWKVAPYVDSKPTENKNAYIAHLFTIAEALGKTAFRCNGKFFTLNKENGAYVFNEGEPKPSGGTSLNTESETTFDIIDVSVEDDNREEEQIEIEATATVEENTEVIEETEVAEENTEVIEDTEVVEESTEVIEETKETEESSEVVEEIKVVEENTEVVEDTKVAEENTEVVEETKVAEENTEVVEEIKESSEVIEEIKETEESTEAIEETKVAEESTEVIEETKVAEENTEVVEETKETEESSEVIEEIKETEESPEVIEETKVAEESTEVIEETKVAEENTEVIEENEVVEENTEVVEETKVAEENTEVIEETEVVEESTEVIEETKETEESTEAIEETVVTDTTENAPLLEETKAEAKESSEEKEDTTLASPKYVSEQIDRIIAGYKTPEAEKTWLDFIVVHTLFPSGSLPESAAALTDTLSSIIKEAAGEFLTFDVSELTDKDGSRNTVLTYRFVTPLAADMDRVFNTAMLLNTYSPLILKKFGLTLFKVYNFASVFETARISYPSLSLAEFNSDFKTFMTTVFGMTEFYEGEPPTTLYVSDSVIYNLPTLRETHSEDDSALTDARLTEHNYVFGEIKEKLDGLNCI